MELGTEGAPPVRAWSLFPVNSSGTWVPTLTNVANIDASTAFTCQFLRLDRCVVCSGKADIDPTVGGGTLTRMRMSLPVAPAAFTATEQAGGAGAATTVAGEVAPIRAGVAFTSVEWRWNTINAANASYPFWFMYFLG